MAAILLATRAAHRALAADEGACHPVHAQVGATLSGSAGGARLLAGVADFISADRAEAAVFGAGAHSARPAVAAASFAQRIGADRAFVQPAAIAYDFLALGALGYAIFA